MRVAIVCGNVFQILTCSRYKQKEKEWKKQEEEEEGGKSYLSNLALEDATSISSSTKMSACGVAPQQLQRGGIRRISFSVKFIVQCTDSQAP